LKHPALQGIAIELIEDNPETQLSEALISANGFTEVFLGSNLLNSLETNRFFLKHEIFPE
jgi:hypothetical protein